MKQYKITKDTPASEYITKLVRRTIALPDNLAEIIHVKIDDKYTKRFPLNGFYDQWPVRDKWIYRVHERINILEFSRFYSRNPFKRLIEKIKDYFSPHPIVTVTYISVEDMPHRALKLSSPIPKGL